MSDKMLKFVKIGQQTPPKRNVDVRRDDFKEIYFYEQISSQLLKSTRNSFSIE